MIRPFLTSLGCPEVLEKKLVPRAKKGRFKKIKNTFLGIHPVHKSHTHTQKNCRFIFVAVEKNSPFKVLKLENSNSILFKITVMF